MREAGDKAGDALESLKAAGKEKFEDAKSEAAKKAHEVENKAEQLRKQGEGACPGVFTVYMRWSQGDALWR